MVRSFSTTWFTDKTVTSQFAKETREELRTLREMIESGQIVSIVDKVYRMDQAAEAHRRVETEARLGAVVIRME